MRLLTLCFRPLSISGKWPTERFVFPLKPVLLIIGVESGFDLKPDEIVIIDDEGIQYMTDIQMILSWLCSLWNIYFARPDSNIHGVNVHTARKRMGAQLAREFKHEAYIVVGVPNSSLCARLWDLRKNQAPKMKWVIKNQNTPSELLPNRLKNCGSKECG